jgi:hypothetical protein
MGNPKPLPVKKIAVSALERGIFFRESPIAVE